MAGVIRGYNLSAMTRRSLIENACDDRSVTLQAESCDGCGTPFGSVDRNGLRPVDLRSRLHPPRLRRLSTFTLQCSCGRISIVFTDGHGGLVIVDPDWITPVGGN